MGIFGHMTANSPLKSDKKAKPKSLPPPDHSSDIVEATEDAEHTLQETIEDLTSSIEKTLEEPTLRTAVPSEEETTKKQKEPHFTIATSPTRRTDDK